MVQIWQSPPSRSKILSQMLGESIGKGLANFTTSYLANKALEGVLGDKSLEDAPPHERASKLQRALQPFGEIGLGILSQRWKIEQQRELDKEHKRQEQEQQVLGRVYSGEKVSPKELSKLSTPSQLKLMHLKQMQERGANKLNTEHLASESFATGYRAILDDDTEALKKVISDPNTPLAVKAQLSNMQNQASVRSDVKAREVRSRQSLVQGAYAKAIAAERSKIGKSDGLSQKDVDGINRRIAELSKLRQKDMNKLLKDPESYSSLSIWSDSAGDYLPGEGEQTGMMQGEGQGAETQPTQAPRQAQVRFDKNNPVHVARAKEVLAEANGDRDKANRILAQEFIK